MEAFTIDVCLLHLYIAQCILHFHSFQRRKENKIKNSQSNINSLSTLNTILQKNEEMLFNVPSG